MSVFEILTKITESKRERNVVPSFALLAELKTECTKHGISEIDMRSELSELKKIDAVRIGRTLNDFYFELIE